MFNLLRKFILILKNIFCGRLSSKSKKDFHERGAIKILQTHEGESPEKVILQEDTTKEEVELSRKEAEITSLPEGTSSGTLPMEDETGFKPPEEKNTELHPKPLEEEVLKPEFPRKSKEEVEIKSRKPSQKKTPTEEIREEYETLPEDEKKKLVSPEPRKEIDLGRRKKRKTKPPIQPQQEEESLEKTKEEFEGKETLPRVISPFIEIDLDNAKVFLVLPEQRFKTPKDNILKQLNYKLELNDDRQTISVKVSKDKLDIIKLEEKRIELGNPLNNLKIIFPDELQVRPYSYKHNNGTIYAFIAIGTSRGRMHYLYDGQGNLKPLPKKAVWILLGEGFDLSPEPDAIEERWIWEKYQAKLVNLKTTNELVIKNRQTGEEIKIPCESSFSIEGDGLVEDDFKGQMPLFAGNSIKIKAPTENSDGWLVWIQNKQAGYKIIHRNWKGNEPLELKLPDDLPCECGEFQVDICKQEDRIPVETLFFRYVPYLQLRYPRELIIPEVNTGHKQEIIQIFLGKEFQNWSLTLFNEDGKVQYKQVENGYQVMLPPEQDIIRFSITKKGKPETETRLKITIPRLKWRISNQKTWNYKLEKMGREDLISGQELYLFINTNDISNKYSLKAILETNGQKLQEANLSRKGLQYIMPLNQFYDTIKQNKDKLTLKVEIRNASNNIILGTLEILRFIEPVSESLQLKFIYNDLIKCLSLPKICSVLRRIKAIYPKERMVCKDILQIYYQKIRGKKKANRDITLDKKDFVLKALAFMKFIMDYYKNVPIRGQKKWRRRIEFIQQKYPEEFNNAYNKFNRR